MFDFRKLATNMVPFPRMHYFVSNLNIEPPIIKKEYGNELLVNN
jgi:hypothetical protein